MGDFVCARYIVRVSTGLCIGRLCGVLQFSETCGPSLRGSIPPVARASRRAVCLSSLISGRCLSGVAPLRLHNGCLCTFALSLWKCGLPGVMLGHQFVVDTLSRGVKSESISQARALCLKSLCWLSSSTG